MAVTVSRSPRSSAPGDRPRLVLALGASLVLHALVLVPAAWWLPRHPPAAVVPPLTVRLPPPEMVREIATQPEALPQPAQAEVAAAPAPKSGPPDKPRELKGRALDTALAALSHEEFYPREAIRREIEGRVVLLLTLDAGGRVSAIEVASSSGHALLDDAALRAATRIAHLPGGQRQVLLPVDFRLE